MQLPYALITRHEKYVKECHLCEGGRLGENYATPPSDFLCLLESSQSTAHCTLNSEKCTVCSILLHPTMYLHCAQFMLCSLQGNFSITLFPIHPFSTSLDETKSTAWRVFPTLAAFLKLFGGEASASHPRQSSAGLPWPL